MRGERTLLLGDREVTVTHADRVLFPGDGFTKDDLVGYYRDVAEWMVPYLHGRPLTRQRWPGGIDGFSFYEKEAPKQMPDWIATTAQPRADCRGTVRYPVVNDAAALAYFANLASITFHVWMSRAGSIGTPDFLLFDLDPTPGCTLETLARVALGVRDDLDAVGLQSLVKTTGGRGLHVLAPLAPPATYPKSRELAEALARRTARLRPREVTVEFRRASRPGGAVYFDWREHAQGKTLVAPYSVRGRPGAPVSMPLSWEELEGLARTRPSGAADRVFARWNLGSVPRILAERGDAWGSLFRRPQSLERALDAARRRWGLDARRDRAHGYA